MFKRDSSLHFNRQLVLLSASFPAVLIPYMTKYGEGRKERRQCKSSVDVTLIFSLKILEKMSKVCGGVRDGGLKERGLWINLKRL